MQFLVIEKVATQTGLAPDLYKQVPDILHAISDYNQALTKQGKVKGSWGFADGPGAAFILDVDSPDELTRLLGASPSNAFPLTREVHPIASVPSNLAIAESVVREQLAHQAAMMQQQRPA